MDLRHLNYFLVLAEELHFGRAAERLHISQPPLTRMIQQIENDLGVALFERTKRSVKLTPAGSELWQDAKQMLLQMQTVKKRLATHGQGQTGTLKVGYVGAVMHSALPTLLADFAKNYPNLKLHFEEQPNLNLVHELNNGTLDVAFVRTWLHVENLQEDLVLNEPFVAILPENHALAGQEKIKVKDLKQEKFITFTRECGPTIFDSFVVLCSRAGFTPHILHHASQLNSVLRLVESGFGISLLPQHVQNGYNLKVKFIPLEDAAENIPLLMLSRKENPNPALLNLRDYLKSSSVEKLIK
ncbi:LysR family transcriptional regulator [Adhaeribacter radiodurans]|uniref:LysR family transcriptional regulator n=1 Tax=Adhaeribacter radiodurans TaxID=2745197 RepID=A0A7L7L7D7_9BACT|nr:LysR family transcriptional regulator [Adhaeribacter radiodurans]QMU28664.1 LysR family transcriptional regulator [Adhaeribacter radiodurans]